MKLGKLTGSIIAMGLAAFMGMTALAAEDVPKDWTKFEADTFNLADYELPEGIDFTQGDKYTLRIATSGMTGAAAEQVMWLFQAIVEGASEGRITVSVHNGGSLGSAREIFELESQGMLDMVSDGVEVAAAFIPEWDMLCVPYAFESLDHALAFMDDEEKMAPFYEACEGKGVHPLLIYMTGFHDISTAKPMVDNSFNGQKIRVLENQTQIDTINAMGGIATPMAWSECYTGLQQGTIEGCATLLNCINLANFYEVQNYTYLTEHMAAVAVISISQKVWDGLSEDDQKLIQAAATDTLQLSRPMAINMNEEHGTYMNKATGGKMQVLEVEDKQALIDEVREAVHQKYLDSEYGDLLRSIVDYEY